MGFWMFFKLDVVLIVPFLYMNYLFNVFYMQSKNYVICELCYFLCYVWIFYYGLSFCNVSQ